MLPAAVAFYLNHESGMVAALAFDGLLLRNSSLQCGDHRRKLSQSVDPL